MTPFNVYPEPGTDSGTQLDALDLTGAAGVGAPANRPQVQGVGWLVIKSDGSTVPTPEVPMPDATKTDGSPDTPVDVAKALAELPAAVRDAITVELNKSAAATAAADAAMEIAKAAQADALTERNARLDAEYVRKADAFTSLPVTAAELGPVLRSVDELLPAEHASTLLRILAAANEARGFESLTKTSTANARTVAPAQGTSGTVVEAVYKAVDALRATAPTMSRFDALSSVLDANPELAAAYSREQSTGSRI